MDLFQQPVVEGGIIFNGIDHGLACIQPSLKKKSIDTHDALNGQHGLFPAINCSQNAGNPLLFDSLAGLFSTGVRLSLQTRGLDYPLPSTSGRVITNSTIMPVLSRELQYLLLKQKEDIEQEIKVYGQRMRQDLEKKTVNHMRAIIVAMDGGIRKMIKRKDDELERARSTNEKLEKRVKELEEEGRQWKEYARKSEMLAWNLRYRIETAMMKIEANKQSKMEGCGESQELVNCASSCNPQEKQNHGIGQDQEHQNLSNQQKLQQYLNKTQPSCKLCRANHVCILLLPCRHLCLCKSCEALLDHCPLCQVIKNASIQVYLS